MAHQDLGLRLLRRIEGDLEEDAKIEQFPKLEGRRLAMVMTPRRPPSIRPGRKPTEEQEMDAGAAGEGVHARAPSTGETVRDEAAAAG